MNSINSETCMIRIEQLIDISLQFYGSQFHDLCSNALLVPASYQLKWNRKNNDDFTGNKISNIFDLLILFGTVQNTLHAHLGTFMNRSFALQTL